MVATASDHVTSGAAGQLVEVGLGHVVELKAELTGKLGHVPKHIAELKLQEVSLQLSDAQLHRAGILAEVRLPPAPLGSQRQRLCPRLMQPAARASV